MVLVIIKFILSLLRYHYTIFRFRLDALTWMSWIKSLKVISSARKLRRGKIRPYSKSPNWSLYLKDQFRSKQDQRTEVPFSASDNFWRQLSAISYIWPYIIGYMALLFIQFVIYIKHEEVSKESVCFGLGIPNRVMTRSFKLMTSPKIIGQRLGPIIEYHFFIVIDDPVNSNSCI